MVARAVLSAEADFGLHRAVTVDAEQDAVRRSIRRRREHAVRDPLDDRHLVVAAVREVVEPGEFLLREHAFLVQVTVDAILPEPVDDRRVQRVRQEIDEHPLVHKHVAVEILERVESDLNVVGEFGGALRALG